MISLPETASSRLDELASLAGGHALEEAADQLLAYSVPRENLVSFITGISNDPSLRFKLILDVTAVDWPGRELRFEVVYHLYSIDLTCRLRVKTGCSERDAMVPSLTPLFPGADYLEREVFDMFGIKFESHPDLRRILMPDEFEHHPLRKDFPKDGIEPEKVYRMNGGTMMPRPKGAEPILGAGSSTP